MLWASALWLLSCLAWAGPPWTCSHQALSMFRVGSTRGERVWTGSEAVLRAHGGGDLTPLGKDSFTKSAS